MMDASDLAEQLLPTLQSIAEWTNHQQVSRLEITLGSLYGVVADDLAEALEDLFDEALADTRLSGAAVEVALVDPGDEFSSPRREGTQHASGWELLVTNLRGPSGPVSVP